MYHHKHGEDTTSLCCVQPQTQAGFISKNSTETMLDASQVCLSYVKINLPLVYYNESFT